jgi:hypothetical protein
MRKTSSWIVILLLGILAVGCVAEQQVVESTMAVISTVGKSYAPTMTASPFRSSTPSQTTIPSSTPTPYEGMYAVVQPNITVQDSLPDNISLNGQLVISDKTDLNPTQAVYYDLNSGTEFVFSNDVTYANSISVFADGSKMFYKIVRPEGLRVIFQDLVTNEKIISATMSEEVWGTGIWQDENIKQLYENEYLPYPRVKKQIELGLPGYENYQSSTYNFIPVMDPTNTYIIYPTSTDYNPGFYPEYVLYNIKTKQIIGQYLVGSLPDSGEPIWSNAGDRFFFTGFSENGGLAVNIVKKNGELHRLAEINQEVSTYTIDNKGWSPDDNYIAFLVVETEPSNAKSLFIIDLVNEEIIKTGVQLDQGVRIPIVWSPDSKQLLVENEIDQFSNEIILFDLTNMQAGVLLENTRIHGWVSIHDISTYQLQSEVTPRPTVTATITSTPIPSIPSFSGLTDELLRNENLSQLQHASSIAEAISSDEYLVTRQQVLSGALIREARTRENLFFKPSVKPVEVSGYYFDDTTFGMVIYPRDEFLKIPERSPCKIVSVYVLSPDDTMESETKQVVLVQAWKTKDGIQYLQYVHPVKGDDYLYLDKSIIILPYITNERSQEKYHDFDNTADVQVPLDSLWIKYNRDVNTMIDEWIDGGIIPDALSYYPLEPVISTVYIP